MTDFDFDEMDKNVAEIGNRMNKTGEEGLKNMLKHFDRIHDKLFSLNTMFIAGFFALIKISSNIYPQLLFLSLFLI